MSKEPKYDVHIKVGFAFMGLCVLFGLLLGMLFPWGADTAGLLHLGGLGKGIHHVTGKDLMVDALMGGLFGLINGVALSIRKELWFVGFASSIIPCGIFGGFAANATPHGYSGAVNALTYWVIPPLITLSAYGLRRVIWNRYQRPVLVK